LTSSQLLRPLLLTPMCLAHLPSTGEGAVECCSQTTMRLQWSRPCSLLWQGWCFWA
jgi:hypothetical protein